MVHVGLDLSRTRLDVHVMDEAGTPLAVTTAVPDNGGLAAFIRPAASSPAMIITATARMRR